jgi:hypothetical protein
MHRFKLFRFNPALHRWYIFLSIGIFAFGTGLFIYNITCNCSQHLINQHWISTLFILQGSVFFFTAHKYRNNNRYFVAVDEDEIRYLLPRQKREECIKFSDIRNIRVEQMHICLNTNNGTTIFQLDEMKAEELKRMKALFDDIKKFE